MVSEVQLGNRENLARALHCSNDLSALTKIQALLRKVPIRLERISSVKCT